MAPPVDPETQPTEAGNSTVPVGVSLGSTRTVIAQPSGDGTGLRTSRTLSSIAPYEEPLTGETRYLYGEDAVREFPEDAQYVFRSGGSDHSRVSLTTRFFDALLDTHDIPAASTVVYASPLTETRTHRTVIEGSDIGDRLLESYPESLCGAIPALGGGLDAFEEIFLVINMGATGLEIAAYRRGEQLQPITAGAVSGNGVDRQIAQLVGEETQGRVTVDANTAREYKETHGNFERFEPFTVSIQQPGGGTEDCLIERAVMEPLDSYLDDVVATFADRFLPALANEHLRVSRAALDRAVILTGGMACLPGIVEAFETRASEAIGREITAASPDRPDLAPALGAQRIAAALGNEQ